MVIKQGEREKTSAHFNLFNPTNAILITLILRVRYTIAILFRIVKRCLRMNIKSVNNRVIVLTVMTTLLILGGLYWPVQKQNLVRLVKSPYSFNKTIDNLKVAIASNNFKLVRQNAKANSHTLYFCNFNTAHKIIKKDKRIGVSLPWKIKILKIKRDTYVATVNVDMLSKQIGIDFGSLFGKIKSSIDSILEEATI